MKRFNNFLKIAPLVLLVALGVALFMPAPHSLATPKEDACAGVGAISGSKGCAQPTGTPSVDSLLVTIINTLSLIVGFAAVVMIIIGGFRFILSGGDSNSTTSARNTILYAVVGLIVVALAQVIVHFVLNKVAT